MSLRNQRTTDTVHGPVSLSRMAISDPGMTRFRLSICARMRQPESLRSLTCQIWGIASDGSDIESDIGLASPFAAKSGEKVGTPRGEMVFSFPDVAAGRNSIVLLLPVLPQFLDNAGKARDGLDRQRDGLALRAALDVDWDRGKENRKLAQQCELPGAHRRRRLARKLGLIPQRSHFLIDHRAQGRRVKVKELAPCYEGAFESLGTVNVDHEPLRLKVVPTADLSQMQAGPAAPVHKPAVRPQCFARRELAAVHGLKQ